MSKKEIEEKYLKKIELLQKHNEHYYDKSSPIISDKNYDELKKDILELEKQHKSLKNKKSPSESIGFKPSKDYKKVKHRTPMLSLGNAFNEEDLINFEKKNIEFFKHRKI